MHQGDRYRSTLWGEIEIVEYKNSKEVTAKFLDSGNIFTTQKTNIIKGLVRDAVRQTQEREEKEKVRKEVWEQTLQIQAEARSRKAFAKLEKKQQRSAAKILKAQQKQQAREVRSANTLINRLSSKEYRIRQREIQAEHYSKNRDKLLSAAKAWQKSNPEKTRIYNQRRRARRHGAEGNHSYEETLELLKKQDNKCTACGCDLLTGKHLDHIIPLVLGGSNYISNIQWLCPFCNLSKNGKHPDEWAAEIQTESFKQRRQAAYNYSHQVSF